MKNKYPRSHIFDLTPDAKIREMDKVLKKLERFPRTPEVVKHMTGVQMERAKLKTELSKQTGSSEKSTLLN